MIITQLFTRPLFESENDPITQFASNAHEGVAEASNTMQRYGQKILKRAKAARAAELEAARAAQLEPKKEEPPAPSVTSPISTRDLMQQLRKPKKKGVAESDLDKYKKYIRPVVKTTPKIEKDNTPSGRTTDHIEWKVTSPTGEIHRYSSKKQAQAKFDSFGPKGVAEGVAEATGDEKFDSMMGQITGGAGARQGVDSLNKSLAARTGSDPETALAKWGQEFIKWLEDICRNFSRQGVDRVSKLEKLSEFEDGGETMAYWLIEVAKQTKTSGITLADIQEFSSEFNTHGMWPWQQFPIAWSQNEWQDYKDQWTGPDGYIANLGQGVAESNTLMNKLHQALLQEGRVKELADDLKTLSDAEFMKKYGKAKAAIRRDMKKPADKKQDVAEMHSQQPKGRMKSDGTRSHSTYGSRDHHYSDSDPQHTAKPTTAKKTIKQATDIFNKAFKDEHKQSVAEDSTENAQDLHIGNPVIITGNGIEFEGATGEIIDFGSDHRFVVVNLYNHGRHSFHSSDVSFNEYADSNDEEARAYDAGEFGSEFGDDPRDLDEARMSAARRMANAVDKQRAKSNASLARTPSSIPVDKERMIRDIATSNASPEHKKVAIDAVMKTMSEHRVKRQALMAQMLNSR